MNDAFQKIESGEWTPQAIPASFVNVNIATFASSWRWIRVGNVVYYSGFINAARPNGAGDWTVQIQLPHTTAATANTGCGIAKAVGGASVNGDGTITGTGASGLQITLAFSGVGTFEICCTGSYLIIP